MALIKCSECGNEVSDKASSCPKCGNPIANEKKSRICPYCKGAISNTATKCVHCYSELDENTIIKPNDRTNLLSVTGFLFGVISLFINIMGIISILGLVFSGVGLTQVNNKNEKGTGFAVLGFLFSLFTLIYFIYRFIALQEALTNLFD